MKSDVIIIIDTKTSMVYKNQNILGVNHENKQSKIIFNFNNGFPNGTAWLEVEKPSGTKGYIQMNKVGETYELLILSSLLNEVGKLNFQLRITQGTDPNDPPVFKSNEFNLTVKEALNTTTEIPEEYPEWIDIGNAKLNSMDEALAEVDNLDIDIVDDSKVVITRKDGTTKEADIGGSGGSSLPDYPTFDSTKKYVLMLLPNQEQAKYELKWKEVVVTGSSQLVTSDNFVFKTADGDNFILKESE